MSRVEVETYIRVGDEFQVARDVGGYDGDDEYVPGAISLKIDGVDVMGTDLWDDVNWLWPFVVQAVDECRRTGAGKRGFPDQPIAFKVDVVWEGNLLVAVTDGEEINRGAVAPAAEFYEAIARAGLDFFDQLQRLCPGTGFGDDERDLLESWLS